MSILMKDQGQRSQLQEKLAAELREKIAKEQGAGGGPKPPKTDTPDFVKDSAYVKDYEKKFRPNGRVVGIIFASVILLVVLGLVITLGS